MYQHTDDVGEREREREREIAGALQKILIATLLGHWQKHLPQKSQKTMAAFLKKLPI